MDLNNISELAADGFPDCNRAKMGQIASALGVDGVRPNHTADFVKKLCLSHLGFSDGDEDDGYSPAKLAPRKREKSESIVPTANLMPGGVWEGKCYKVILNSKEDGDEGTVKKFIWEGMEYKVPYDEEVSVPAPVVEIIRNAKTKIAKWKTINLDGARKTIEYTWHDRNRFSYSVTGVDEETANLPSSIQEWYHRCEDKGLISKATKRELSECLRRLRLKPPEGYPKNWDLVDEDIQRECLRRAVGLDPYIDDDLE